MATETKVAIVTGGSHGIGEECVRLFLSNNMHVVIADVKNHLIDFSHLDSSRLLFVKTDVKSETSVKIMIKKTISHFGRLDALINNAGILPNSKTSLENTNLKIWQDFIDTNLTGAFLCSKYALPYLKRHKGSIVNIASTRALQSEGSDIAYSASKGGLVALTHAIAVDLGPDVRVNCVSPGWIHTHHEKLKKKDHQQHPVGRVGEPQDISHMVAFLISDQASFITGQNFIVDGGMTIKMIYN